MKTCCHKSLGILVIRLLIGWIFLYHGIMKITMIDQMIPFIWWAADGLWLTFLSATTWFWIVSISEILAGTLLVIGLFTRLASFLVILIMLVAMNTMGRGWMQIELPFILMVIAIALFTSGPGRYSIAAWTNCTQWICGTTASCCNMPAPKASPAAKPAKKIVFKKKK